MIGKLLTVCLALAFLVCFSLTWTEINDSTVLEHINTDVVSGLQVTVTCELAAGCALFSSRTVRSRKPLQSDTGAAAPHRAHHAHRLWPSHSLVRLNHPFNHQRFRGRTPKPDRTLHTRQRNGRAPDGQVRHPRAWLLRAR